MTCRHLDPGQTARMEVLAPLVAEPEAATAPVISQELETSPSQPTGESSFGPLGMVISGSQNTCSDTSIFGLRLQRAFCVGSV